MATRTAWNSGQSCNNRKRIALRLARSLARLARTLVTLFGARLAFAAAAHVARGYAR